MTATEAIGQIEEACKVIALQMMKIHPAARALSDEEARAAILKSAHALTVELESIKKRCVRLRQRDDSTLL